MESLLQRLLLADKYFWGAGGTSTRNALLLGVVFVATVGAYWFMISSKQAGGKASSVIKSKPVQCKPPPLSTTPANDDDVWEERRRRGIATSSTSTKANVKPDKPFGSSYYYAHNNTNAKGGYSSGLRMEDYTMNKPRLLSKNGSRVDDAENEAPIQPETPTIAPQAQPVQDPVSVSSAKKQSKNITRYLWDDPGDSTGVATIRIDTLPGASSSESLAWKDAEIETVSASLEGEGLVVTATAKNEDIEYRLNIKRLYDKASEVRTVVKPKRLLVKIHKKRGMLNFLGKSNMEAWPHPQRKDYSPPNLD